MSERGKRKQQAAILAEKLAQAEQAHAASEYEIEALTLAKQALLEEPKLELPCCMLIEYTPFNAVVDRCRCSECGGASLGFTSQWKACPLCGASIAKVEKESSAKQAHERNIQDRVKAALNHKGETCQKRNLV